MIILCGWLVLFLLDLQWAAVIHVLDDLVRSQLATVVNEGIS